VIPFAAYCLGCVSLSLAVHLTASID
jgi:hypothetical protein